jgi:hypothetical protein
MIDQQETDSAAYYTVSPYQQRDGDAGGDDGVAAEVCVGEGGAEDGRELHAAAYDVGDLRGVDGPDVVLADEVDDEVAAGGAHGHPQPYHAPCTASTNNIHAA